MAGSLRATRPRRYTTEEAVDLLFSLDDGAELPASLVEDVESDDGDGEEPDYVTEDGSNLLVPPELLGSVPNILTDEPALRDSLLHLDSDLASENTTETGMLELSVGCRTMLIDVHTVYRTLSPTLHLGE